MLGSGLSTWHMGFFRHIVLRKELRVSEKESGFLCQINTREGTA